jgi:hypothetical protein
MAATADDVFVVGSDGLAAYDKSAGSMRSVADPSGTSFYDGLVRDGVWYVVESNGGIHKYDISADSWSTGANPDQGRLGPVTGGVNGQVILCGGIFGTPEQTELYDPSSDSWTTVSPMPTPVDGAATATVDGQFYVIGGNGGGNTVQRYDPSSDSWTTVSPIPTDVDSAASGVDGEVYAYPLGSGTMYTYDPAADSWSDTGVAPPKDGIPVSAWDGETLWSSFIESGSSTQEIYRGEFTV